MRDLLEAYNSGPHIDYGVGKVVSINASLGTVAIDWRGGRYDAVPYLLSYTPVVNDKVQVISGESIGALVLGKTVFIAAPPAATERIEYLYPIESRNWSENVTNHADGEVVIGGVTADEDDIPVKQGVRGVRLYSGSYAYGTLDIPLAENEMMTRAELLIFRIDESLPMTVSPVLTQLTEIRDDGKPLVAHPEFSFVARDMLPGDHFWVPIPLEWAQNLISNLILGFVFSATSAQLTLTYSEYAAASAVAETSSGSMGGTLRLTIENRTL